MGYPCVRRRSVTYSILVLLGCIVILQVLLMTRDEFDYTPIDIQKDEMSRRELLAVREDITTNVTSWNQECDCGLHTRVNPREALIFPATAGDKVFLTIGIPTVHRKGDSYILQTLDSLISNMADSEQQEVIIVVFLADTDTILKKGLADEINSKFGDFIKKGLIHVIQAPRNFYPPLAITKHTYGQPENYIKWRAKQNFDYSYLFRYSKNLSAYYMQIEDDVTTVAGYIRSIKEYIKAQQDRWTCLEFSELGFIGKLYHVEDLEKLAMMMMLFYEEQPVDYTYLYFNLLTTQMVQRLRKPTLFQHMGIHSSYPGKIQPLKDRFFDNMTKAYNSDNPPAEVFTSMKVFLTFVPRLAYARTEGYFWSHGSPGDGDSFTVIFEEPQKLYRVVVETGSVSHPEDRLEMERSRLV